MENICAKCGKRFDGDSSNIIKIGNKYEVCCGNCMPTVSVGVVEKLLSQSASKGRFKFVDYNVHNVDINIIVDRYTGVNYMIVNNPRGLGITPLIGQDGKPIVTKD